MVRKTAVKKTIPNVDDIHEDIDYNHITSTHVFYKKDTIYSFTLNPSDKHQYFGCADRLTKFHSFFYLLFQDLPSTIQYHFCIELSEPTHIVGEYSRGPRLHFHGVIRFTTLDSIKNWGLFHLDRISRDAQVMIDTCSDILVWQKYCYKYYHIMRIKPLKSVKMMHNPYDENGDLKEVIKRSKGRE